MNVADIGAIDAGGFCPRATEIFQEGFSTTGLKLIERGKVRRDILGTILNMVRDPGMVALDLKLQIAASNVAKSRFLDVVEKYGWDVVDEVSRTLISQSENLLRRRLTEFPDGVWRAREYMDMPEKTYKYRLAMQKKNDELSFDFTGSSEQAPISVNCTYWATYGGVFAPLFPLLCHDITWNDGVIKPISIIAPEGTIVNCKRPAPVSVATISSLKIVNNLATMVISKLLMTSPKYKNVATVVWQGTHTPVIWFGITQFREFFVTPVTDGFGGSGGARTFRDGVDVGGELANVFLRWANVETHEQDTPVLYLFRKRLVDSGGPGRYRGGISHEYAVIPYDAPYGEIRAKLFTKGVKVPLSHGVSGGYGDPLEREPQAVRTDLLEGIVSADSAGKVYVVVVDPTGRKLDEETTRLRRDRIREDRLKHSRANKQSIGKLQGKSESTGFMLNEYLQVVRSSEGKGYFQCQKCNHVICAVEDKWKEHAPMRESPVNSVNDGGADGGNGFVLREFFCQGCGTLLEVEVAEKGEELIYDEIRV